MAATPYKFGAKGDGLTDDTDALGRWAMAGGGEIPHGTFRINAPLRFGPGFTITRWEGKILYGHGWASGYALCSRDWTRQTPGVRIDASAGGEIVYHGDSDMPRKGLGLTFLDDFEVINATVVGGAAPKGINLFSCEVRNSRRGVIRGGLFSVNSGQQGADGIHFTANCSDIELVGVRTGSGDDSVGLTVENPKMAGSVMERIKMTQCALDNEGHSSLKILLASFANGSIIRGVTLKDCTMRTKMAPLGAGLPVAVYNRKRATGAKIEHILIEGGTTEINVPEGGRPGGAVMEFYSADDVHIVNHDIHHWQRMAIMATDCARLVVEGGRFEPIRPVPRAGTMPLFRLAGCPDARIDVSGKTPGWAGQPVITHLQVPASSAAAPASNAQDTRP